MIHPDMPADADQNFKDQDVGDSVSRCDGTDPSKFKVRIVDHERTKWTQVYRASSKSHEVAAWESAARRQTVLDTASLSFHGDIFASNMHTLFSKADKGKSRPPPLGINAEDIVGNSHVLTAELCSALKAGRRPPAAVVLMGCNTEPMLANVLAIGVGAAFGIAPENEDDPLEPLPTSVNSLVAADATTAALMEGKTLNQAAEAGTKAMNQSLQSLTGAANVKVVVECGSNDPNKSLQANGLLYIKAP